MLFYELPRTKPAVQVEGLRTQLGFGCFLHFELAGYCWQLVRHVLSLKRPGDSQSSSGPQTALYFTLEMCVLCYRGKTRFVDSRHAWLPGNCVFEIFEPYHPRVKRVENLLFKKPAGCITPRIVSLSFNLARGSQDLPTFAVVGRIKNLAALLIVVSRGL